MKKVQHEESVARKKFKIKRVHNEKSKMKKCNTKRVQHEENALWKKRKTKKECNRKIVQLIKIVQHKQLIERESKIWKKLQKKSAL